MASFRYMESRNEVFQLWYDYMWLYDIEYMAQWWPWFNLADGYEYDFEGETEEEAEVRSGVL